MHAEWLVSWAHAVGGKSDIQHLAINLCENPCLTT